ncbi:MAG: hypothetical protein ACYC7G_01265 [Rudaea sp.]
MPVLFRVLALCLVFTGTAFGQALVQYNPTGSQQSTTPLSPTAVSSLVTASTLVQSTPGAWFNTNVWPVPTSGPFNIGVYTSFTIQPTAGNQLNLASLSYDAESYFNSNITLHLRSSLDGFASDIGAVNSTFNGTRTWNATFNLSALPRNITSPVEFRLYPDNTGAADFADLVSTAAGGNGLVLSLVPPAIPALDHVGLLLLLGALVAAAWMAYRRMA